MIANIYKAAMNRFLTKKKTKDAGGEGAVSEEAASRSGTPTLMKRTKKWRKGQPEPKPELDLSVALPSTENFRTSLIMPSLSTRFSMLREQDDPTTKIGKASDDSVLQPNRHSRLMEFGYGGGSLADIAEVSSISSQIRPPFASERQGSYASAEGADYGTDDDTMSGSIMNRARPGEGNILFGGRQKIYKIPTSGSTKNLADGGMGGRALYEDDVAMSAFQRYRKTRKEEEEDQERSDNSLDSILPAQRNDCPNAEQNNTSNRRETSSSTTSSPSLTRSSTAATSIASQGAGSVSASSPVPMNVPAAQIQLERSVTKSRKLYENSLDQQIQEQHSSPVSRFNSIQKQRHVPGKPPGPHLLQAKSASNLHDRFNRGYELQPFRAMSPPLTTPQLPPLQPPASKAGASISGATSGHCPVVEPVSPVAIGSDEQLAAALQPGDKGKATALGAFNKPHRFDEQQYLQRTLQMHNGRETPQPLEKALPLREIISPMVPAPLVSGSRQRAPSNVSTLPARSTPATSDAILEAPTAFSVFQNAASQIRAANGPSPAPSPRKEKMFPPRDNDPAPQNNARGSNNAYESAGSVKQAPDVRRYIESSLGHRLPPPMLDHPAIRPVDDTLAARDTDINATSPVAADDEAHISALDIDSPTLGPTNGGLSGLVRQHLRSTSNVSSIYTASPTPAPVHELALHTNDVGLRPTNSIVDNDTPAHSSYSHSNPWDLEDLDTTYYGEADSFSSNSPTDPTKAQGQGLPPIRHQRNSNEPHSPTCESAEASSGAPWEREMRRHHIREGSSETRAEREAFANELAARQKAIQESLRNKMESESVSASPLPAKSGTFKAIGMLRSKQSRESVRQESSVKAMKTLGIGSMTSPGASTVSLSPLSEPSLETDRSCRGESSTREPSRPPAKRALSPKPRVPQHREHETGRHLAMQKQKDDSDEQLAESPQNPQGKSRSPPSSTKSSVRNRSSSEVSAGRSRSRVGRYRDDLEKAMAEGTGTSVSAVQDHSTMMPPQLGFQNRKGDPSPVLQVTRLRSNSRSAGSAYFDHKAPQPIQTGMSGFSSQLAPGANSPGVGLSPRPSPGFPSPGLGLSPRPSPVLPYSAHSTPLLPSSTATTPLASGFPPPTGGLPVQPITRLPTYRKKSIQKSEISQPTLISFTSTVETVDLPPGASLKNGAEEPPPVPPINPRRRRGNNNPLFAAFGRGDKEDETGTRTNTGPVSDSHDPFSTFSADEEEKNTKPRQKLRKSSSEGRNLNGRARQQMQSSLNPSIPSYTSASSNSPPRGQRVAVEGGMF